MPFQPNIEQKHVDDKTKGCGGNSKRSHSRQQRKGTLVQVHHPRYYFKAVTLRHQPVEKRCNRPSRSSSFLLSQTKTIEA